MGNCIANVVFDAPAQTLEVYARSAGAIASLYAELLGRRVMSRADHHRMEGWPGEPDAGDEVDPLVFAADPAQPNFAFEAETAEYRPPRWPDQDHPQQVHLDVEVADLDAAAGVVLRHGGVVLAASEDRRVCADAVGHPLCLVPGDPTAPTGRVARIVFDGPSPRSLARFWGSLLDLPVPIVDTPERVELAAADRDTAPTLAFQHSLGAPPRWPDPAHPQQLHVDLALDDPPAARELALRLGAVPLPYLGGGHALADPAGHPFCVSD